MVCVNCSVHVCVESNAWGNGVVLCVYFREQRRMHRSENSSGTVVRWISGRLEVLLVMYQVK